ncbi:BLUF domain-containing protein [Paracoccus sp. Ld10]|uniref:BLUF domain-containing protein n=1 Tax=Paracoccus sp. Ld10 TaxID=649158 RepID=UPI00386FFF36
MSDDSLLMHRDPQTFQFAAGDSLGYLLYRSVARPGMQRDDLDLILQHARDSNRAAGLTGCLHHEDGLFFQWIEGPRFRLFRLIDLLSEDDRHLNFTVLDQGPLQQRLFGDWEMRFSDREAASLLDWLAVRRSQAGTGQDDAENITAFLRSMQG